MGDLGGLFIMNDLFIYAVKVNASLVVFYLFYKLFFQRDTFWNLRRSYLLVGTLFSFVFPFISMQEWLSRQQPVITTLAAMPLEEFVVGPAENSAPGFFTLGNVLTLIFVVVVALFLLHTFIQFLSILRQRIRGEKMVLMGVEIIRILEKLNPFSFFKWIFINPEQHNEQETGEILEHELTHVREWHSIDVVLAQVMRALCWINPAAWLLEYEIRLNLEFLADNAVIRSGVEPKKYQYHLLTLTYEPADSKLANNFNILPLKKRIKMMNTRKTKKTGLLKYALVAPLALALLLVSNMQDLMASAKNMIEADNSTLFTDVGSDFTITKLDTDKAVLTAAIISSVEGGFDTKDLGEYLGDDDVYDVVTVQPSFPGGNNAMYKWLGENIKYPAEAQQKKIQGRVILQMVIAADGTITKPKIIRGVDPLLDAEALRVINAMPKWIPAKHEEKAVNVRYTLPVQFKLVDKDKNQTVDSKKETVATENSNASDKVFSLVEQAPSFPGGNDAMYKWLGENIKYPAEAEAQKIQGRVVLQTVIAPDGTVTEPRVVRGVDPLLDAEALRVVNAMPKWIPGKQGGKAVNVRYTIPVNFRLKDEDKKQSTQTDNLKLRQDVNQPVLVIVDGKEFDRSALDVINPDDVESVSVLKDKSATAIYGDKGKDGVILITTKKAL